MGEKGFAPDVIYDDVDDKTRADKTFVTGLCGDRGVSPPLICQVPIGGGPCLTSSQQPHPCSG